jgi:hypothetical protein
MAMSYAANCARWVWPPRWTRGRTSAADYPESRHHWRVGVVRQVGGSWRAPTRCSPSESGPSPCWDEWRRRCGSARSDTGCAVVDSGGASPPIGPPAWGLNFNSMSYSAVRAVLFTTSRSACRRGRDGFERPPAGVRTQDARHCRGRVRRRRRENRRARPSSGDSTIRPRGRGGQ